MPLTIDQHFGGIIDACSFICGPLVCYVCPVGRSCSQEEREQFNAYDQVHQVRRKFIQELEAKFGADKEDPLGLVYSIGGQISFDAFPKGWDKTFCLSLIDKSHKEVHFFGDKTDPGGNDHEIYADPRTVGHTLQAKVDELLQSLLTQMIY